MNFLTSFPNLQFWWLVQICCLHNYAQFQKRLQCDSTTLIDILSRISNIQSAAILTDMRWPCLWCVVYSSRGHTYVIYARRSESWSLETKHLCMRLALECALDAMLFMWSVTFGSLSMVRPRSLTASWIGITHSAREVTWLCKGLAVNIQDSAFLVGIFNCQSLDHLVSASRLSSNRSPSCSVFISLYRF